MRAAERDAFRRAFESPVLVDAVALERTVVRVLEGEILRGYGLARRASQLVPGRSETFDRLARSEIVAIVVARDLAPRSQREVETQASGIPIWLGPPKDAAGAAIGRRATGVLGLLPGQVTERLLQNLERFSRLEGLSRSLGGSPSDSATAVCSDGGSVPCESGLGSV